MSGIREILEQKKTTLLTIQNIYFIFFFEQSNFFCTRFEQLLIRQVSVGVTEVFLTSTAESWQLSCNGRGQRPRTVPGEGLSTATGHTLKISEGARMRKCGEKQASRQTGDVGRAGDVGQVLPSGMQRLSGTAPPRRSQTLVHNWLKIDGERAGVGSSPLVQRLAKLGLLKSNPI